MAPFTGKLVMMASVGTLEASSAGKSYCATRASLSSSVSSRPTMRSSRPFQ